jgi:Tfp pilus assembly protein PilO
MNARMRLILKVGLAFAVVSGSLIALVVLPAAALSRLREDLRLKSDQLLIDTALIVQFQDPDSELREIEEKQRNLEKRFPTAQDIPFVLQQLGEKSREQGLDILSIRPLVEEDKKDQQGGAIADFKQKKILLELICDYEGLGKYLASLDSMPTFFTVEELRVRGERAPNALDVQIVLGFYVGQVRP